jgi:hypothetical protein
MINIICLDDNYFSFSCFFWGFTSSQHRVVKSVVW